MKQKNKPRNKAFDQIKGFVLLVAVVVIGVMAVQNGQTPPPPDRVQGEEQIATVTPVLTVEATMGTIEQALMAIQSPTVQSVFVNNDIKRVLVVFTTTENVAEIDEHLTAVTCAARQLMPKGYDLRLGGKLANDITVVTAQVSATNLEQLGCPALLINWATFASEYSLASGLITPTAAVRAAPRQSFTCPSNCDGAVAMGLSAAQAASCGLDRDGDGVACYGD